MAPGVPPTEEPGRSRALAFWTSLPGVLTGIAAVLGAVAGLMALFTGGTGGPGDGSQRARGAVVGQTGAASRPGTPRCAERYFAGIAGDRIAEVEVGTEGLDVIAANQPKAGAVGLTLKSQDRPVALVRFAYFPDGRIFKVESIVDATCAPIETYTNASRGGDKHVLQDSDTLRLEHAGAFYDLRLIASSTIRLVFTSFVP